jgi:hypothetical protein
MKRKHLIGNLIGTASLVVAVFVCMLIAHHYQQPEPSPPPPGHPGGAFVPLEKLVLEGWFPHIVPNETGPFRYLAVGGPMLVRGTGGRMKCSVDDDDGRVVDEVVLEESPDFDFLVRRIESESGRRFLLVLKRPGG